MVEPGTGLFSVSYLADEVCLLEVVPLRDRTPPDRIKPLDRTFRHPNTRRNRSRNLQKQLSEPKQTIVGTYTKKL